jgi:hypothetical protein
VPDTGRTESRDRDHGRLRFYKLGWSRPACRRLRGGARGTNAAALPVVTLRAWRLVTLLLTALSMSAALGHLLELPAKMRLDGPTWVHLLQTLYPPGFGTAGAVFEVGAVVSTIVLAVLVRRRPTATIVWTLAGTLCVAAAHAVFWTWNAPVNATLGAATAATLPIDWMQLRAQWEYAHAARALLQIGALGALVWSVLRETPDLPVDARQAPPQPARIQAASVSAPLARMR